MTVHPSVRPTVRPTVRLIERPPLADDPQERPNGAAPHASS